MSIYFWTVVLVGVLVSPTVACDKPRKSPLGYLVCEPLQLLTDGNSVRTSITLDPAVQYDVLIQSRHTLLPLLKEQSCQEYVRRGIFSTSRYQVCKPAPPVRFDGRQLSTLTMEEIANSTEGSYFLYNLKKLKPYITTIKFKFWGHGRRLAVALSRDFSEEILKAKVIIKDSKYIIKQQVYAMEKAAWEIERDTLRRQRQAWWRERTQLTHTIADLERRLQNSDADLTIQRSQLKRSRAEHSELSNANKALNDANMHLRKQIDGIFWLAFLVVVGVVVVALFRGRKRKQQALVLAFENDALRLEIDEKDRHIADLVDNLATLMSRSGA